LDITKLRVLKLNKIIQNYKLYKTRMWANAQRDGRPAEYRWRPLFHAAVWLTPSTRVPCSNAVKTRKPLKFAGVLQTSEPISSVSEPKFTILSGHVEKVLLFNEFFSDCRYMPYLRRYSLTNLCDGAQMVNFWRFLGPAFPGSCVQHISHLHSKFALGPHHVSKYRRHPICDR